MHVKRVRGGPLETDALVRPILAGMPREERRAHISELQSEYERRIETLELDMRAAETEQKKAAIEYQLRREIFDNPVLSDLTDQIETSIAQTGALQDEISDLHSLVLLCKEKYAKDIVQVSRN